MNDATMLHINDNFHSLDIENNFVTAIHEKSNTKMIIYRLHTEYKTYKDILFNSSIKQTVEHFKKEVIKIFKPIEFMNIEAKYYNELLDITKRDEVEDSFLININFKYENKNYRK